MIKYRELCLEISWSLVYNLLEVRFPTAFISRRVLPDDCAPSLHSNAYTTCTDSTCQGNLKLHRMLKVFYLSLLDSYS